MTPTTGEQLERGRGAYRRRAWREAHEALSLADAATPLEAEDLEQLATAAYLLRRNQDFRQILERAADAHLQAGRPARAARCAFWLGLTLLLGGQTGQATGWLSRARRFIEGVDCVEHGYLLLPVAEQHLASGAHDEAHAAAADAAATGERFGDADLIAFARHIQGRRLIVCGSVREGLALLDEAMLAVVEGELSPIVTGLVYCSVIEACQEVFALDRAHEWTSALHGWCEEQPELIAFSGTCLVHRAEILQAHGDWRDALDEACHACDPATRGGAPAPPASAYYRQAEIHRLRGNASAAEEAYRQASRLGGDPQPGLALLRLTQRRIASALAAVRRAISATAAPLQRLRLLPAYVEIALAAGEMDEARRAASELEKSANELGTDVVHAMAAQAGGAVALARGEAAASLAPLRSASETWRRLGVPYEAARVRGMIGLACRSLGDEDAAALEFATARDELERLGARPALAQLEALGMGTGTRPRNVLSPRELQVLRRVAAGKSNRSIASELNVSERTIDRHVSNIFTKLGVASRAAATASAYEHNLL